MQFTGRLVFWFLSLGVALVSLRFLALPLAEVMPNMAHYLTEQPLPLYAHILFGPLAMVLAPFQFWSGLRRSRPRLHRVLGNSYVLAILLAGLGTLAFLPVFPGSLWATTGFAILALLWLGTTARAVWLARAGRYVEHRAWMIRSAALTWAAVTLRLIMPFLILRGWSVVESYDVTAWACWLPNLIAAEIWLRKNERAPEGAPVALSIWSGR